MDKDANVLIVGAGPTGLVLALCLQQLGIPFRIVDKAPRAGTTSRALVVHARTLEFYRQLGVVDAIVERAQKFAAVNLWVGGKRRAQLRFGDIGANLSMYPYSLIFPQDQHEEVLIEALHRRNVSIERDRELVDITSGSKSAACSLRHSDGRSERCEFTYVAACDGAHSAVREKMRIGLPGGTYSHLWYVADVEMAGPLTNGEVHISMDQRDALAIFPMKEPGTSRLVGQAPPKEDGAITWDDVNSRLVTELQSNVTHVRWFSSYRVHHRVAHEFRKERVFLLGDAAHLHSPVGGQGMNTGIGDAVNLAWKLASVLQSAAAENLLDTYAPERMSFARGLVRTTDAVFSALNSNGFAGGLFRTLVTPIVMPALMRMPAARRAAFRILSQTSVNYRRSALSQGRVGAVRAGDRLPWVADVTTDASQDNFEPLNRMRWQVHVYGDAKASLRRMCDAHDLPLHTFKWQPAMQLAGVTRDALYLVRPDGHVAIADRHADADLLEQYLRDWGLGSIH